MNPHSGKRDQAADARESINRVLEAEKRMAADLENCRRRAEEIVEKARARARRIARRTEGRVHLLHQRFEAAIADKVSAIESGWDGPAHSDAGDRREEEAILHRAVERLAATLTTAERDDPRQ